MSDSVGHYCGLACVRLRKPLEHFVEKYQDPLWGLRRLYLLMEKQRNRGQDGAGVAVVKFDMKPGEPYLVRNRQLPPNPIDSVFNHIFKGARRLKKLPKPFDAAEAKRRMEYLGDVQIGHLRYGTHGGYSVKHCQPYVRRHNQLSRNLAIAGNFNLTNSRQLFSKLVEYGLHPSSNSDTQMVLEKLSYSVDEEHRQLRLAMGPGSLRSLAGPALADAIAEDLNIARILRRAARDWDGGYAFAGLFGHGDAFVCRDPAGIRPGFYYKNDEVIATASERSALVTCFDIEPEDVHAIKPAHALIMKKNGDVSEEPFTDELELRQCTFERVYFSRGNDRDIYQERKNLGAQLAQRVLDTIDHNMENTVFSFVPNTAETAFIGLLQEMERHTRKCRIEQLWKKIQADEVTRDDVEQLMRGRPRVEKAANKDQKLRTFITRDLGRKDLVSHVYDITPGVVSENDTLVVLDDSIVRGTTLRDSIIMMLARLNPKRIIIISSSPPIMYPDCYGIDMSHLGKFIAFEAAVHLLRDRGEDDLLKVVEEKCRAQRDLPPERMENHVGEIYERFTLEEISQKVSELIHSQDLTWSGQLDVMYQSVEGLRASMPGYTGDWYFTGNYPTPGGYRVLNQSYLNWADGNNDRAY